MFGSDNEAPINVRPKTEKVLPPPAPPIPENMERASDSEEEYYFLRPKPRGALPLVGLGPAAPRDPQTESKSKTEKKPKGAFPLVPHTEFEPKDNIKDIIKTKPNTKANTPTKPEDNMYSKIKFRCGECNKEFKNEIAITTHSYSHNCKYLENTEYYNINSSQNMKEFYITDKAGNYIEVIDEAINHSLEEIKNCYQIRKNKSSKYKVTALCEYKKRNKEEVKTTKIFFNTDYIINK